MLRVLSLNVWFDLKLRGARTRALLEVVRSCQPSICCFQEVVPEVAVQLMQGLEGWSSSDPGDGSSVEPYGVMALAAPGLEVRYCFHEFPTRMGRRLLVADIMGVCVATVHLESLANHPLRVAQLRVCADVLARCPDVALVGDFNFDSERNYAPPHIPLENDALSQCLPGFVDAWASLQPSARGLTYDSKTNPYIGRGEQMRYDRAMTRMQGWAATSIELIGDERVDHLVHLSAKEQDWLERPPTPPRPRPQARRAPDFLHEPDEGRPLGGGGPPHAGGRGREDSPPPGRRGLFLSDHFGLLLTCRGPAGQ